MNYDFDVCIVGSGAGGGMTAWRLSEAGYSVLLLEKGEWFKEKDFFKDELACCQRSVYTPSLEEEQHVIEEKSDGKWEAEATSESGWDFWNGCIVGGASNFMSGFFYRMKPVDFRLKSEFGPIDGANVVDWPFGYEVLEPYFSRVESIVGISGHLIQHPQQEPRSTETFPYPATVEHPVAAWIDESAQSMGLHPLPVPRAILPYADLGRSGCVYSGYCGSYGCATGAKGSSRAALIDAAVAGGRCEVRASSKVYQIETDAKGKVSGMLYFDEGGNTKRVTAKLYVVACNPIESVRLLLSSPGPKHPRGLGNRYGQLGKNLIFSAGGVGSAKFLFSDLSAGKAASMKLLGPFENRGLQDWYVIEDKKLGRVKGGTVDLFLRHPNPISRARRFKWKGDRLRWGTPLKQTLKQEFTEARYLKYEIFTDWLPTDDCFVSLDPTVKDKWGSPVARVRLNTHPHDLKIGRYIADRVEAFALKMGATWADSTVNSEPPPNLVAGGASFGTDPQRSVLDVDCRVHDAENLFVTDASFMPTGGSVPYTWTIYANALRVAEKMISQLGAGFEK